MDLKLVSVVIPNYNYAEFVAQAIESALGLDWPQVEVIVVDDGSSDGSRAVIQRYADRVQTIFQANSGQRQACNVGFSRSKGEVVIFLDSDDLLAPSLVRELASVWHSGVSKVQFQMRIIDVSGQPTGAFLPQFGVTPTPEKIRRWVMTAGAYPTPPGSGNAYARTFLEKIFPLEGAEQFSDSYCLAAAPYLGDVVTITKPLVSYRVHGRNAGAMSHLQSGRLARELAIAEWRFRYAQQIASSAGLSLPPEVFARSMTVLAYRMASLRLEPEQHPQPNDSVSAALRDFAAAFFIEQGLAWSSRSALLVWATLVAVLPHGMAERLVLWRFASGSRPLALRRLLRGFRILQSSPAPRLGRAA